MAVVDISNQQRQGRQGGGVGIPAFSDRRSIRCQNGTVPLSSELTIKMDKSESTQDLSHEDLQEFLRDRPRDPYGPIPSLDWHDRHDRHDRSDRNGVPESIPNYIPTRASSFRRASSVRRPQLRNMANNSHLFSSFKLTRRHSMDDEPRAPFKENNGFHGFRRRASDQGTGKKTRDAIDAHLGVNGVVEADVSEFQQVFQQVKQSHPNASMGAVRHKTMQRINEMKLQKEVHERMERMEREGQMRKREQEKSGFAKWVGNLRPRSGSEDGDGGAQERHVGQVGQGGHVYSTHNDSHVAHGVHGTHSRQNSRDSGSRRSSFRANSLFDENHPDEDPQISNLAQTLGGAIATTSFRLRRNSIEGASHGTDRRPSNHSNERRPARRGSNDGKCPSIRSSLTTFRRNSLLSNDGSGEYGNHYTEELAASLDGIDIPNNASVAPVGLTGLGGMGDCLVGENEAQDPLNNVNFAPKKSVGDFSAMGGMLGMNGEGDEDDKESEEEDGQDDDAQEEHYADNIEKDGDSNEDLKSCQEHSVRGRGDENIIDAMESEKSFCLSAKDSVAQLMERKENEEESNQNYLNDQSQRSYVSHHSLTSGLFIDEESVISGMHNLNRAKLSKEVTEKKLIGGEWLASLGGEVTRGLGEAKLSEKNLMDRYVQTIMKPMPLPPSIQEPLVSKAPMSPRTLETVESQSSCHTTEHPLSPLSPQSPLPPQSPQSPLPPAQLSRHSTYSSPTSEYEYNPTMCVNLDDTLHTLKSYMSEFSTGSEDPGGLIVGFRHGNKSRRRGNSDCHEMHMDDCSVRSAMCGDGFAADFSAWDNRV